MSQKIFRLGLDTEAISLYLLCCGLADVGDNLSTKNLKGIWNGSPEALATALSNLTARGIVRQVVTQGSNEVIYRLNGEDQWS